MDLKKTIQTGRRLALLKRIAERDAGVSELEATGVLAEEVLHLRSELRGIGQLLSTVGQHLGDVVAAADRQEAGKAGKAKRRKA